MSLLQRLRQGQGRAQQQLLSLAQWHQQAQAAGGAVGARGFADQPPAVKFAKDRAAFEDSMSELRKQWAQKRQEREAAKAAAEEAARAAREAAKAQRAQSDLEARARRMAAYQAKLAEEHEERMAAKAERLKREQLRSEVLDVARAERRARLLRQSAGWVTPQTLDARIKEALDNPVPLHADG